MRTYTMPDTMTLAAKLLQRVRSYDQLKRQNYWQLSAAERRHLDLIERTAKAVKVRR